MIAKHYPVALGHLEAARQMKTDMAAVWNEVLDRGLSEQSIVISSDGTGEILAYAHWPEGTREQLTSQFREFVGRLWSCLDSLITESVDAFSVFRRKSNPERPRFFPVADSRENFVELLDESCLDGVLTPHFEIVRDCQPFMDDDGDQQLSRVRSGLRQLIEWENALDNGEQITAWATPVDPEIYVHPPVVVESLALCEPGVLFGERLLATFTLRDHRDEHQVSGRAGTYVDICFATGFEPSTPEDTFDHRQNEVIQAVTHLVGYFAMCSDQVAGPRQVRLDRNRDAGRTWADARLSERKWSEADLEGLKQSDVGLGRVLDTEDLTLIVSTSNGVFERTIPRVTPLREHDRIGYAAEAAIQDAAATWGLPDFVHSPLLERKGTATREISDGLLVVGRQGVIVQAKAREVEPGSPEREVNWIKKQIGSATRQINGTARRLKQSSVEMENGRGRTVRLDGPSINWVGVVVIEHPRPPADIAITVTRNRIPVIALLRRDWEFLFDQLRSTYAVVEYLHRVAESTELLGREPERYYELAALDAESISISAPMDDLPDLRGVIHSVPLLPTAPAGSDNDAAHGMVRIMLEDIATTTVGDDDEESRLRTLASIDSLPIAHRTELGQLLLDALAQAQYTSPGSIRWQSRTFLAGPDRDQLGFAVCSEFNENTRGAFTSWELLRHHERGEHTPIADLTSVGVLLTPRTDGWRQWDTTVCSVTGDPQLTEDELRQYRELWNDDKPQQ